MPTPVLIEIESVTLKAELNDTPTAQALAERLPLTLAMSRWGDEYYGDCGVSAELAEDARDLMEVGALAFWPPGKALCVFFGPTPASSRDEPRAASAVNIVGRLIDDPIPLRGMPQAITVTVKTTAG